MALPAELYEAYSDTDAELIEEFQLKQADYVEDVVGYDQRLRCPNAALDIDSLGALMKEVIDLDEAERRIKEDRRVYFTEEWPPEDLETICVSFGLVERHPGTTSGGRFMNQRRQEWKPRVRETVKDKEKAPGYNVKVLGQYFDNVIEFTCWSKTSKEANGASMWFEDLVTKYRWYIRYKGINDIFLVRRMADRILERENNQLFGRPLRYFVKTERLTKLEEPAIRRALLKIGIEPQST